MTIRRLTPADRAEFVSMGREFYTSGAVLHDIDPVYHERAFDELMRSDVYLDCVFFEEDGAVIGYALLNKSYSREVGGAVVWVEELYVRSEYRCKGVGNKFFDWLEENVPASRYRLEIEPDNERARKLYENRGYCALAYRQMVRDVE